MRLGMSLVKEGVLLPLGNAFGQRGDFLPSCKGADKGSLHVIKRAPYGHAFGKTRNAYVRGPLNNTLGYVIQGCLPL